MASQPKNPKAKKILFISLFALDMVLTCFLFVVSIIMLATMPKTNYEKMMLKPDNMIHYFQKNPTTFLLAIVVPLIVLLLINVTVLVLYLRKSSKAKKVALQDLNADEKEALRKQLLADMQDEEKKD